jgi:hypothetical protein
MTFLAFLRHPLGRWIGTRVAPLLLIALWVLVGPLAAASPPDPTWISGFYDDDDFDDVVTDIGLLTSASDASGPPDLAPDSHVWPLASAGALSVACARHFTLQDRSPPLL